MISHIVAALLLAAGPPCGPLDLDTALGLAVTRSDEVAIKQADVTTAHADEALASSLRIIPQGTATVLTGPAPEARGDFLKPETIVGTNRSLTGLRPFVRIELQALQPIYTWGRLDAASEAARAGLSARELLVQDTTAQVQFRVVQLYWGVSLTKRLLAVASDVRKAVAEAAARVDKALKEGDETIALADRYRVDVFRGVVEARAAEAQKGLELARIGLAATLGADPERLALKEAPLEPGAAAMPDRAAALAAAEQQRPDLRALDQAIAARDAEVKAEHAAAKPQFFIGAQFTYSYASNRDLQLNPWVSDYFNTLSLGAALGVRQDFAVPMLSARTQKAQSERAALARQRDGLARLVQVQVDSALAELRAAQARLSAAQGALGSGKALFRSTGLDFETGLVEAKTLIDAYAVYVETQVTAAQSAYDLLVSRARLAQVTGEAPRKGVQCELP
jgi:outer membrane protein, multidrug efflux system